MAISSLSSLTIQILMVLIRIYQYLISPLIGLNCRFQPTCSHYVIGVLYNFGVVKGVRLAIKRILKCHPLNSGGDDPIPQQSFDNREE